MYTYLLYFITVFYDSTFTVVLCHNVLLFPFADHIMQRNSPRLFLSDLTVGPVRSAVCVRVMRRWIHDGNEPGGAVRYIAFVLADEKVRIYYVFPIVVNLTGL